jgi:hypothetical protein
MHPRHGECNDTVIMSDERDAPKDVPLPPDQARKPPVEMPPDHPGIPPGDEEPPPAGDPAPNEPTRLV